LAPFFKDFRRHASSAPCLQAFSSSRPPRDFARLPAPRSPNAQECRAKRSNAPLDAASQRYAKAPATGARHATGSSGGQRQRYSARGIGCRARLLDAAAPVDSPPQNTFAMNPCPSERDLFAAFSIMSLRVHHTGRHVPMRTAPPLPPVDASLPAPPLTPAFFAARVCRCPFSGKSDLCSCRRVLPPPRAMSARAAYTATPPLFRCHAFPPVVIPCRSALREFAQSEFCERPRYHGLPPVAGALLPQPLASLREGYWLPHRHLLLLLGSQSTPAPPVLMHAQFQSTE